MESGGGERKRNCAFSRPIRKRKKYTQQKRRHFLQVEPTKRTVDITKTITENVGLLSELPWITPNKQ